jgi:hypothetical protein
LDYGRPLEEFTRRALEDVQADYLADKTEEARQSHAGLEGDQGSPIDRINCRFPSEGISRDLGRSINCVAGGL